MFYDRKKFFDSIRANLAPRGLLSQGQVDGFERLVSEGEDRLVNTEWISYILATAWYETAYTMQPVRETLATSDQQAIDRLNAAYAAGKLGQVSDPYWRKGYFGRGYVQLTHDFNYARMGSWLGIDLLGDPSLALDPAAAAKIIYEGMIRGLFTVRKLSDYLDGVIGSDAVEGQEFLAARAVINGTDKAGLVAGFALKIEAALHGAEIAMASDVVQQEVKKAYASQQATFVATNVQTPVTPGNPPYVPDPKPALQSTTIWTALGALGTTVTTTFVAGITNPWVQGTIIVVAVAFAWWIIRERLKGHPVIEGLL